jgi:hypothetical protein
MLSQTLFGVVVAAGLSASSPTPRLPDPCQQATRDVEDAEDELMRWCANHDKRYGACVPGASARGRQLERAYNNAVARRAQACT